MDVEKTSQQLRWFAQNSCRGQSQLYEFLCEKLSEDDRLLRLIATTSEGQPIPNLFLAAVHFLLLSGVSHELADYYGTCVELPLGFANSYPVFQDFCEQHEDRLREILVTRRVQTNEVRRCSYLLPAFGFVRDHLADAPLSMVEVGCSAGLMSNWDRYRYSYSTGISCGSTDAKVHIQTDWRGTSLALPHRFPEVAERVGIDLHVVNLNDPADALWLRSLIWPDQPERMALIQQAISEFQSHPVNLIEGDALELLPTTIESRSPNTTVCVFHCHVLNQFTDEQRQQFQELLATVSAHRPIVQVSAEWIRTPHPELHVTRWEQRQSETHHVATMDHHGRWVEWKP